MDEFVKISTMYFRRDDIVAFGPSGGGKTKVFLRFGESTRSWTLHVDAEEVCQILRQVTAATIARDILNQAEETS